MTIPAIERQLLDTPGDVLPRPYLNSYWLIPAQVLAGEHPGAIALAAGITRVDALLDAGVRRFVDLTAEHEGPAPYAPILFERAAARGVRVVHGRHAIPDFGVPSSASMRATLDVVYEALAAGETAYVHCWGGVGRTGTVVGCLLREQGYDAAGALGLIAAKWRAMAKRSSHPASPETPGQIAFIERWHKI